MRLQQLRKAKYSILASKEKEGFFFSQRVIPTCTINCVNLTVLVYLALNLETFVKNVNFWKNSAWNSFLMISITFLLFHLPRYICMYIYKQYNMLVLLILHVTVPNILFKIGLYIFEWWDELIQLWFGTQSFMLVAAQTFLAKYVLQMEGYNTMVSCNTIDVSPLCHAWKGCPCFGVCIFISVPFIVQ